MLPLLPALLFLTQPPVRRPEWPVVPPAARSERRLQQPLKLDGKKRLLTEWVALLERGVGMPLMVSELVPPAEVALAGDGAKGEAVLEALAGALDDTHYRYFWQQSGKGEKYELMLARTGRTHEDTVQDVLRGLSQVLKQRATFDPRRDSPRNLNQAIAARYSLLAGLPGPVRAGAVREALSKGRVYLPLWRFDRRTLVAACGGVEVRTRNAQGQPIIKFSSSSIERGDGYVVIERLPAVWGSPGLWLRIGSGPVPPGGRTASGPASELLHAGNGEMLGEHLSQDRSRPDPALRGTSVDPEDKVSLLPVPKAKPGEAVLLALLRQLASGSGRVVACRLPKKALAEGRLEVPLTDFPVAKAAERIAGLFQLESHVEKALIWFAPVPTGVRKP